MDVFLFLQVILILIKGTSTKRKGEATQSIVPCSIQDSEVSFHVLLSVAARDKHALRETHYYYNIWFYFGILIIFRNIIKGWFKKLLQPFI